VAGVVATKKKKKKKKNLTRQNEPHLIFIIVRQVVNKVSNGRRRKGSILIRKNEA
jgi:hypothetical protein